MKKTLFFFHVRLLLSVFASVWHTRVLPRIAAQEYGDKNKLKW